MLALDPEAAEEPRFLFSLATACHVIGKDDRAVTLLKQLLARPSDPMMRAGSLACLGEIARDRGATVESGYYFRGALEVPGLTPSQREMIERGIRGRR